jgi:hypothetical protein
VLSIIGLLYLILSYNGIIRYFNLHFTNTELLIEKYKNIPKLGNDKIIISFEWKDNNIKSFMNSLLDQSIRVDDIGVTTNNENSNKIQKNNLLNIYTYSKDYEKCGNMINCILREPEANTKIILLDSDMVYGDDFIETLVSESNKNPDKIICGNKDKSEKNGILIKPKFFDTNITKYQKGMSKNWLEQNAKADFVILNYSPNYKSFKK